MSANGVHLAVQGRLYDTSPEHGCTIVDTHFAETFKQIHMTFTPQGYITVAVGGSDGLRAQLHNYIYEHLHQQIIPSGMVLHHINNDKFDNRLTNLQLTTINHNAAAVDRKKEGSHSRFKGVSRDEKTQRWKAQINTGKDSSGNVFLGHFDDELEAAKTYDRAFIALHGTTQGCNGELQQDDVDVVLSKREAYLPKPKRADRSLPKFISMKDGKFFRVMIEQKDFAVRKQFPTLEEAVAFRDEKLTEIEARRQQEIRSKPILRNVGGVAIIPVKIPKSKDITYTMVSDEDYYDMVQIKWYLNRGYAWSRMGEMHCLLMRNDDRTKVVDHINHDRLDNRRTNLRIISRSFSNRNKRKKAGTSSKYQGVSWCQSTKKWTAQIKVEGQTRHLGHFDTEADAAERYQQEYDRLEQLEMNQT